MSDAHNEVKSILEEANKKMDKSIEAFKKRIKYHSFQQSESSDVRWDYGRILWN